MAAAALAAFARSGYHGTTVADVAREAKISPAYVFKLYSGKEALFVVALEACFDAIVSALEEGADAAADTSPEGVLDAMGDAYAHLISDRKLLMLQVHAQSVAEIPRDRGGAARGDSNVSRHSRRPVHGRATRCSASSPTGSSVT